MNIISIINTNTVKDIPDALRALANIDTTSKKLKNYNWTIEAEQTLYANYF